MSKKVKKLTEKEYNEIRQLLSFKGMTNTLAAKICKRSVGTMSYIRRTNTFAEYQELLRSFHPKEKAAVAEAVAPQATPTDDTLADIAKQLRQINEKLVLVAVPKRRFFGRV